MTEGYPRSMADLASWADSNGVTATEARLRFAQYAALCGIASVTPLRESLVFKGGNALDFVWQPNRSTVDLDFSLDMDGAQFDPKPEIIRGLLQRGFGVASQRFGIVFAVHRVEQQPRGEEKTFVTYTARVGYALPDETKLLTRIAGGQASTHVLPIEISLNEPIGASIRVNIDRDLRPLRVSTIEDIVGEKLRSLLQQPIRNRNRRQDVLDIAVTVQMNPHLDRAKIAAFLLAKANARNVEVSKAAFRNTEVADRARVGYDALKRTTRTLFIPFEEAFALVLALSDELPIPDR